MLFLFDLPMDEKPEKKENVIKPIHKKKMIILVSSIMLIVALGASIGILAKSRVPKNISPYCMLMRDQGKVCKIHNKKHNSKDASEMIILEEEMAFHKQLYDEVSNGAYFDGERLYKKENAKEILDIRDTLSEKKESLFERYLSSTLTKQEKEQYNIIIEEIGTMQEVITKLDIQETEQQEPSKEDLIKEVESLKKELSEVKAAETVQVETAKEQKVQENKKEPQDRALKDTLQSPNMNEDKMLYGSNSSKVVNIPKDIEKAATIKKSSLYN